MKLTSIAYRMGSKTVSNQDLLDQIKSHSHEIFEGDLDFALSKVKRYFSISGAKERRWLADDEHPIELACEAIHDALDKAQLNTSDIDLMIHVGLGRGFMEAGQAYFVAQAMKMGSVHCFDIMDACNSWSRGLFIANSLLKCGEYKNILLINTECNLMEGGSINPSNFKLNSLEDVDHCFAGITLGDAVSATIVQAAPERHWDFEFSSRADIADLCAVPADNYKRFSLASEFLGKNGTHQFSSFASLMQKETLLNFSQTVAKNRAKHLQVDWLFPHGHTKNIYDKVGCKAWQVTPEQIKWNTYRHFGNFASASIPIAIAMGIESGEVKRGQRLITAMASGGLSFSSASFIL